MSETVLQPIHNPLTIFLVGVTGDLAKKKILKAIYNLHKDKLLPEKFNLIGNARRPMSQSEFREFVKEVIQPQGKHWKAFEQNLYYVAGDAAESATFQSIKDFHAQLVTHHQCGNHMWYIATLPSLYVAIVRNIRLNNLHETSCGWTKILIEKPFGTNYGSAQELNNELTAVFQEEQIFRIDHTLGKETVQNLLAFRFANGLFEHLWNKNYIDHIQVTYAETLGIAGREVFYDQTGAIRDIIQNHCLQLLAMTMMEEPKSFHSEDIRHARSHLLAKIVAVDEKEVENRIAFGQYAAGTIEGQGVRGYRQEHPEIQNSFTETAVAMKLEVNNQRWQGVPIYIRTGKRLAKTVAEVSIQFKEPQNTIFKEFSLGQDPNVLTLRIQPNEGIVLRLFVKRPGHGMSLDEVPMQFCYRNKYQMGLVEAYERLIHDASEGDSTLFPRADAIQHSWALVDPFISHIKDKQPDLYPAGSWGPLSFDGLLAKDGKKWIEPSVDVCSL